MNLFGWLKRSKLKREIIVNVERLETRVAVMENGRLEEYMVEHPEEERLVDRIVVDHGTLPVDGLFCLRDSIALNTLLPKLALDGGHIAVDRAMATNLPGCYAAGDCTGRPYQYAKAVGEGNVAAHSAIEYLG